MQLTEIKKYPIVVGADIISFKINKIVFPQYICIYTVCYALREKNICYFSIKYNLFIKAANTNVEYE